MRVALFAVAVGLVGVCGPCSWAQDQPRGASAAIRPYVNPARIPGTENAAVAYLDVWDTFTGGDLEYFNQHEIWVPAKHPDRAALAVKGDTEQKQQDFLTRHADAVAGLIKAAGIPDCAWNAARGEETPQFFEVPVHLSWLRSSSWLLAADAERCIKEKNAGAAVERIVALIRLTRQSEEGQFFFLAAVSRQWCGAGMDLTDELRDAGQLTPNLARPILVALKTLPANDPLGMCACLPAEQKRSVEILRARYTGAAAGARFMADSGWGFRSPLTNPAWGVNQEQFEAQLRRYDAFLSKVAAVWCRPNGGPAYEELLDEAAEGQFGVITPIARKPGAWYYGQMVEIRERVGEMVRMLAGLIAADARPNPAAANPGAPADPEKSR